MTCLHEIVAELGRRRLRRLESAHHQSTAGDSPAPAASRGHPHQQASATPHDLAQGAPGPTPGSDQPNPEPSTRQRAEEVIFSAARVGLTITAVSVVPSALFTAGEAVSVHLWMGTDAVWFFAVQVIIPALAALAALTLWALTRQRRVLARIGAAALLLASIGLDFSWLVTFDQGQVLWTPAVFDLPSPLVLGSLVDQVQPLILLGYVLFAARPSVPERPAAARLGWRAVRSPWARFIAGPVVVATLALEVLALALLTLRLDGLAVGLIAGGFYGVLRHRHPGAGSDDWIGVTLLVTLPALPAALYQSFTPGIGEQLPPTYIATGLLIAAVIVALALGWISRARRAPSSVGA
jgi:hypothetical protein